MVKSNCLIAVVGVKGHLSVEFWHLGVLSALTNQEMMGLVPVGLQSKAQGMLIPDDCLVRSVVSEAAAETPCLEIVSQAPFGASL